MIEPLQNYILVEIIETNDGIVTSTDITETKQFGKVVSIGPDVKSNLEVNDYVYWEAYAEGTNVPAAISNQGMALIREDRMMAREKN